MYLKSINVSNNGSQRYLVNLTHLKIAEMIPSYLTRHIKKVAKSVNLFRIKPKLRIIMNF